MTQEEFKEKVLALTPTEERIKSGKFSQQEFLKQVLWDARLDDRGYYYFSNRKMTVAPENYSLRFPIVYSPSENSLRLLIHTRFTKIPYCYCEFIGIHYVYSGKMISQFPGEDPFTLTKGQLIMINENVPNSFEMQSETDVIFGIQIQKDYLKKELLYGISGNNAVADFLIKSLFGDKTDFSYKIFDFSEMPRMTSLLIDLFCEYLDPSLCGKELVQDYMHIFFILLIRASGEYFTHPQDRNIIKILEFIEKNSRNCTLDLIAKEFKYNPKYVSNLLKKKTGYSFSELLIQARMKSICYFLTNTKKPVEEIAAMCGYTNQTFFYRKFKEIYHMTPHEYREKLWWTEDGSRRT